MPSIKRGTKIIYKGVQYTVVHPCLNFVKIQCENGKVYKLTYDKIKPIDQQ